MCNTYYDPEVDPVSTDWLAMSEQERVRLAGSFHRTAKIQDVGSGHAALHAVVENYLAQGFGPTRSAMERLVGQGFSRHEAIHRLGRALMKSYAATESDPSAQQRAFAAELKATGQHGT